MALKITLDRWLALVLVLTCIGTILTRADAHSGQAFSDSTFFCPCFNRKNVTFSFVMHSREPTTQMGLQLRAGVQQAMRDRNLLVNEYLPVDYFKVIDAVAFLNGEIAANTAGIITTFYSDLLLPSLAQANEAGIPIYIIGGADPDLYQDFQGREPATGPIHASIRYIGADMEQTAVSLASRLMARGITHLECIASDLAEITWYRQCGRLVALFQAAGLDARRQLRAPVVFDLTVYVTSMAAEFSLVPAREIAIVVADSVTYKGICVGLADSSKANALVVVYETSVDILEDVRTGRNVLALDFNYYAQGFLGLALASAERQTGQMVTSDIMTEWTVYGQGGSEVTDAIMQREVCRAARNPVCGDPGVAPVTPTGCPCFNRSEVAYKVVGVTPSRVPLAANIFQGVVDAQRDLPGSSFQWDMQLEVDYDVIVAQYAEVASNTSRWRGVISLDTLFIDVPRLTYALRALSATGKPLYMSLLQAQGAPNLTAGVLASVGARPVFVGANALLGGYNMARYATQLGYEHLLGMLATPFFAWAWMVMRGVVTGVLGSGYQFPNGTWDWPLTAHGNATQSTGAWSLFVAAGSNHTVQIANGLSPLDYLPDLKLRLSTDAPAPDMVVSQAYGLNSSPEILAALGEISEAGPERPPIGLMMHQCTKQELQAFLRLGYVPGEERLMGCMDDQAYLSTYLMALLAALEQHTGERVVGEVHTERLIRVTHLPLNFETRVACEVSAFNQRTSKGILGTMYPVCDVRQGCVDPDSGSSLGDSSLATLLPASLDPAICSGHGICEFVTALPKADVNNPNLTYSISKGVCECQDGWSGEFCSVAPLTRDGADHRLHVLLISLAVSIPMLALALAVPLLLWSRLNRGRQQATVEEFLRKRAPPKKDDRIVAVFTDIEGSTSLWEWNPAVMSKALAIHHNVLRMLLPKYHGYESDTEGDSFSLIFHDPVDALGWAMDVQRTLLFPSNLFNAAAASTWQHRKAQSFEEGLTDWPAELLTFGAGAEVRSPSDNTILFRGLRVRMGIHIGKPDRCTMHPNGRQHYQGEVMEVTRAIQDSALSGGQVLMSMPAWQSLGMHSVSVVCHDMGLHEVGEKLPPVHLLEVLPLTLVKRAPFPHLKSRQLSPSFFDAPGTRWYYVGGQQPKEPVVIAFIYVGGAKLLRRVPCYHEAAELLTKFVQEQLARYDGYECEEKEGNFLLAFRSADKAAQFAVTVQRDAMMLPWPCSILEQELAAEIVKSPDDVLQSPRESELVVFRGLRLQIGLCMGVPSDVQPHRTTGRAAYFGPIVNRAARIAATAACGQTLANHLLYESIKESCPDLCFKEMGRFDLKGVKDSIHVYQVSSPELSSRLFPRTLKVAAAVPQTLNVSTEVAPIVPNPAPGSGNAEDEKQLSDNSVAKPLDISIHSDIKVTMHSSHGNAEETTTAQVELVMHSSATVPSGISPRGQSPKAKPGHGFDYAKVETQSDHEGESFPPLRGHRSFSVRPRWLSGLEERIRAECQHYSYEELLQLVIKLRIDRSSPRILKISRARMSAD